ncbi:helix-turn-helix transcriptional regulator [Paenibacillus sp.]|uniref:AraC family transcriptional regulator n=1 Tax=Paenibacillus sp. TaxID=58172 RepID=UPI002D54A8E1|nr:helix-turn-helix transcriptional regulator [Paenibacillus sp.]HZG85498.1 helix-turn-helix transcriptional regulator [Paenibacillus sp.]
MIVLENYKFWKEKPSFLFPVDRYPSWVLFLVEEGAFSFGANGAAGEAGAWQLVACPPHAEFHRAVRTEHLSFHFIQFRLAEEKGAPSPLSAWLSEHALRALDVSGSERVKDDCRQLKRVGGSAFPALGYQQHYVLDMLLSLFRDKLASLSPGGPAADPLMAKAKEAIERGAFRKTMLQDIAGELGLSKAQLTRRFRDSFGLAPMEYLTAFRLEKAKKLLTETDLTLDAIARDCGFGTGFYFSRVFSRHFRMTPSRFRRMQTL